jgi:hypothetical protein
MKVKLWRYGLKIWVCGNTEVGQVLKLQVLTGMTDGEREVSRGTRVVINIVETYFGSRRVVTIDKALTSVTFAEEVFIKGIRARGTMRCNRRQIPKEFLLHSERDGD